MIFRLYKPGTDVAFDFKNIFAQKVGEIIRVFGQTTASFCKKFNLIIGF
jgi:hypothetical protein